MKINHPVLIFQEVLYCLQLRARTSRRPFTIICNNCLSGFIYKDLARQYATPFVGLFLYPECFVRMKENFHDVMFSDLKFVDHSRYELANRKRKEMLKYPVGILADDVEIHFNHYNSIEHARSNWMRRRERMSVEHLCFILVQRELCTNNHVSRFLNKGPGKAVAFVSFTQPRMEGAIPLKGFENKPYITDLVKYPQLYRRQFDMARWLSSGRLAPSAAYRMLIPFINAARYDYSQSREVFVDTPASGDRT